MRQRAQEQGPAGGPRPQGERGFSLLEILVVLGILGLMASLVVVNLGGATRMERLRAAARKIAGMSDYVRSEAAAKRRLGYLDMDFDNNRFRFRMDTPRNAYGECVDPEDTERILTQDEIDDWKDLFSWEALPRGVYFRRLWVSNTKYYDKEEVEIRYNANGTLNTWVLWLQAAAEEGEREGPWFSVKVNGLTGKGEVLDDKMNFATADESDFRAVMGNDLPGGSGK